MLSEASFIVKGVASVKFEYSQECFLGYFNGADLLHALLAFFCFSRSLRFRDISPP